MAAQLPHNSMCHSWLLPGEGILFTGPGVITLQVDARELPAPEDVLIEPNLSPLLPALSQVQSPTRLP